MLSCLLLFAALLAWPDIRFSERTFSVNGLVLLLSFLYGATLYRLKHVIPFNWLLVVLNAFTAYFLIQSTVWDFLGSLFAVNTIILIGCCNPHKPFRGDYSYGIFLYHFVILQALQSFWEAPSSWLLFMLVGSTLTFLSAYASWHMVEKPMLRVKQFYA